MGKLVVTEFVSLDGVMESPGGEDFKYPGWSFAFDRGEDGNQFKLDETLETEALLIGRVTYESFAGAWPEREGEFADKFNTMPKYVVSSTLEDPEWNNTTVLKDDVVQRGHEAEGADRRDHPDAGEPSARGNAARARSGRRAPLDGVPSDPRNRAAPVR